MQKKKPCHNYRRMSEGGAVFSSQSACLDWLIPQCKEVFSLKGTRKRERGPLEFCNVSPSRNCKKLKEVGIDGWEKGWGAAQDSG